MNHRLKGLKIIALRYRTTLTFSVLIIMLITTSIWSLCMGEMALPVKQLRYLIFNHNNDITSVIFRQIRVPRLILGLAAGASLSLAGMLLQGIFQNPLIEPYTMGISGGAAFGVAIAITLGLNQLMGIYTLPLCGFGFALLTIFIVYHLSLKNGKVRTKNMLLIGVMLSFVSSSAIMFLMATTTSENLQSIIFWIMGSLDETSAPLIALLTTTSLVMAALAHLFVTPLNALRLGEDKARHLGINANMYIKLIFILASALTGITVAVTGVIGFVGLVIPHILRSLLGNDYKILLSASYLAGATFMVFCDAIARTIISPNELPIGVITGMIGGTVFMFILSKKK